MKLFILQLGMYGTCVTRRNYPLPLSCQNTLVASKTLPTPIRRDHVTTVAPLVTPCIIKSSWVTSHRSGRAINIRYCK